MLRRHLRYYSFNPFICYSLLIIYCLLLGCAPKAVAPPPSYKDIELSLKDIITIAGKDINTLKIILSIEIEKDDNPYSYVDASLLLKKPDLLNMKVYTLGMLTGNFIVKGNEIYALYGKIPSRFKDVGRKLHHIVFWWEGLENAVMSKQGTDYVIREENKEIYIDSATLLPTKQVLKLNDRNITIFYYEPRKGDNIWYPSIAKIETGAYRFHLKIEKLIVNPLLEEDDFKVFSLIQDQ